VSGITIDLFDQLLPVAPVMLALTLVCFPIHLRRRHYLSKVALERSQSSSYGANSNSTTWIDRFFFGRPMDPFSLVPHYWQ